MSKEMIGIRHILGLKVHHHRIRKGLSFQELSTATGLSVSYLNEIEKGKKYPKGDKMIKLAAALDSSYDELVSLKVPKQYDSIVRLLQSNFFKEFPLDMFGLDVQKVLELVASAPEKFNAFITTIVQIARNYEMRQEQFYLAAVRAYQEIQDNYFEEIEEAALQFRKLYDLEDQLVIHTEDLEEILTNVMGYTIEYALLAQHPELQNLRSLFDQKRKKLMLNKGLTQGQLCFLLARELGFAQLQLDKRPISTPPVQAESFEESLHNYQASYFSAALMMPKEALLEDIKAFNQLERWDDRFMIQLLDKYQATPEMLMQRLTNLLPKFFKINNLFFLRFVGQQELTNFRLTKELHLSKFHQPHANETNEHYCRRWISFGIMKKVRESIAEGKPGLVSDIQRSKYINTSVEYMVISMAWPNVSDQQEIISVSIGFLIDANLKKRLKMLDDAAIKTRTVHTTCERCPLSDCQERVAPPVIVEREIANRKVQEVLGELLKADKI